jgi:hypothetical protein
VQVRNAFFWPFALTAAQVGAVTPTSSTAALPAQALPAMDAVKDAAVSGSGLQRVINTGVTSPGSISIRPAADGKPVVSLMRPGTQFTATGSLQNGNPINTGVMYTVDSFEDMKLEAPNWYRMNFHPQDTFKDQATIQILFSGGGASASQDIPGYKGIYDRDFPGNDVQVLPSNDLKACLQACNARADCKGFVVATDSQNCWLKGSFGTSVPSTVRPTYIKTQQSIFSFFGSSYVTLYVDCNYSGQVKALAPGAYRWLPDVGFPNDALSAVRVPPGRTITIFEDSNFGGRSLTIKRDEPCFAQNQPWFLNGWWNDKASSVIIS